MLYNILLVVHIILCLILVGVILLQAGRGGGLADAFGGGGGGAQSFFGTRGAAYLTKMTTIFAAGFMVTSVLLATLSSKQGESLMGQIQVPTTAPAGVQSEADDASIPPIEEVKKQVEATVSEVQAETSNE